jgi:hypothetical protein
VWILGDITVFCPLPLDLLVEYGSNHLEHNNAQGDLLIIQIC